MPITEDDAKLLLLGERLGTLSGAETILGWDAARLRELVELVRQQKGACEERDVCLLSEVKAWFKRVGIARLGPREAVVKAIQAHLWPKPPPKSEDVALLQKDFLRAAQQGSLLEAQRLLTSRPSVLAARSSSKGYGALHYAAMAGALPMIDWLCAQGLAPDTPSTPPPDGASPPPRLRAPPPRWRARHSARSL